MIRGNEDHINQLELSDLIGMTLRKATTADGALLLETIDGRLISFDTVSDCCNYGELTDVCGDLADLVGTPIVRAECPSSDDPVYPVVPLKAEVDKAQESETWTFLILGTTRGTVTIRWYGTSNGYYCEDVVMSELPQ
jgi:hypothetical protein